MRIRELMLKDAWSCKERMFQRRYENPEGYQSRSKLKINPELDKENCEMNEDSQQDNKTSE